MRLIRISHRLARPAALCGGTIALLGVIGYGASIEALYRPTADGPASHPLTLAAAAFLALAAWSRNIGFVRAACFGVFAVLGVRLLFGGKIPWLPDHFFLPESARMGGNTVTVCILLATSLLLRSYKKVVHCQFLAFIAWAILSFIAVGYLYSLPSYYGQMSLPTFLMLASVAFAVVSPSAHRGLLKIILNNRPSGQLSRIQMLFTVIFPLFVGYVFVKTLERDLDAINFGYFLIFIIFSIVLLISVSAVYYEKVDLKRRRAEKALLRLASYDFLTGLLNRRAFTVKLEEEIDRTSRYGGGLALLMLDIDHFKKVNDTGGHPMGDKILAEVAGLVRRQIRVSDAAGRLGGEEFAILLANSGENDAYAKAETLRALIEDLTFEPWQGHDGKISASIGCSVFKTGDQSSTLISRADEGLYQSKKNGRNQVTMAK